MQLRLFAVAALVAIATLVTPAVALANAWYTYYDNYFFTFQTCQSRGETMIKLPSEGGVPGIIAYECYQSPGDAKFSMDVYDTYAR